MKFKEFDRCVFYFQMTDAEWEVVKLCLLGWTVDKMADRLCVCGGSVKFHITNVLKKAKLKSRLELVVMYYQKKYMGIPPVNLIEGKNTLGETVLPMGSPLEQ